MPFFKLKNIFKSENSTCAVIVAGGSSTRMGENYPNKQFIKLNGMETIVHSALAFEKSDFIKDIIVVTKEEYVIKVTELLKANNITKLRYVTKGGQTRFQSVLAGIGFINKNTHVAIHDAARPLITTHDINRVCQCAYENDAAVLVSKVVDTIKKCDENGYILTTIDRTDLYCAQTPQVFSLGLYQLALNSNNNEYTDDAQLLESYGANVKAVIADYENIKLTTKNDILIIESILKEREKADEDRSRV